MKYCLRLLCIYFISFPVVSCGVGPGSHDFIASLIGGYYLCVTNSIDKEVTPICRSDDTPIIPKTVVKLNFDDKYIYAKIKSAKNGTTEYWVLDPFVPKSYGYLTYEEYKIKLKELGISNEPELLETDKFRKYEISHEEYLKALDNESK